MRLKGTLLILLLLFILAFGGCALLYEKLDVKTNGYLRAQERLNNQNIFVYKDLQAPNPLLNHEVGTKIENRLTSMGWQLVDNVKASKYVLVYIYNKGNEKTKLGRGFSVLGGELKDVPKTYSVYTPNLIISIYSTSSLADVNNNISKEQINVQPIWVGESVSEVKTTDFRSVVDYLIVSALERIGENTGEEKNDVIYSFDSRLKTLYLQ